MTQQPSKLRVDAGQTADPTDPNLTHPSSTTRIPQNPTAAAGDESDPPATQMLESLPIVRNRTGQRDSLQTGRRLGPYLLLNIVGRGPHGLVFEAEDTVRLNKVAVKVIAPELASRGPNWIKRFLRAAKLPTQMSHPGVLDVLTLGQEGPRAYYAMPLLPGRSLAALLRNRGVFAPAEAIRVARQLAESLAFVHSLKLTHANIKPSNVFLDTAGQVKLADFALPLSEKESPTEDDFRRSVSTDLRLWAALFHRLLTGRPPGNDGEPDASIPEGCAQVIRGVLRNQAELGDAAAVVEALSNLPRVTTGTVPALPDPIRRQPATATGDDFEEPAVGQMFGKCLLLERIGRGSAGAVFKARHQTLNIPVAVKVLNVNGDSEVYRQLRVEAQLLAQLNHPHIVRVWDFDDDPQRPYLVLEYVDGPTLADVLRETGRFPAGRAVQIIGQIADGLSAAHRLGIVHRDVKPSNILLTPEGNAKLADLGLAVCIDPHQGMVRGGLVGTVAYMAPEQALGANVDHRADIYSLGATLYQMVTGEMPFIGNTPAEVLRRHAQEPLVPAHHRVPTLPEPVSAVIEKMMAKRPEDRYSSDQELLGDLIRLDRILNPLAAARAPSWRLTPAS
ncbi:MAG: serine/threonine-protein kinase [Gemmataceae bacterium]|nr:serine/threonine-protein kinase [Gemmataceae bacterium]